VKNTTIDDAIFLDDGAPSLQRACQQHGLDFIDDDMEIGTVSNVFFVR